MLSISNSVTDNTLKESLQNTTGLLVDHGCDTLDVVTKNLAVTLGSSLSETLATLSASSHIDGLKLLIEEMFLWRRLEVEMWIWTDPM